MSDREIADWFNQRWKPAMGAIDGHDVRFIARLIDAERPKSVVEIGCASGLSTVIMAALIEQAGGGRLDTFDWADRYYIDPSRPVGFFLDEALPHPRVSVKVHTGKTSLDIPDAIEPPIDLCFIDATHKHPWPLIDTLAVLPFMRDGGTIIHHDLQMFRNAANLATGPKILYDQVPAENLIAAGGKQGPVGLGGLKTRRMADNIFAIRVTGDAKALAEHLAVGFYLGWDREGSKRISTEFSARFTGFLRAQYAAPVAEAYSVGLKHHGAGSHRADSEAGRLVPFLARVRNRARSVFR